MGIEYTDDMNEISGCGGDYERACREAVEAGSLWVALHPDSEPDVDCRNGTVSGSNAAGASILAAINGTPFTMDDGRQRTLGDCLTAQQYYLILQHITLIALLSWDSYADMMRACEVRIHPAKPRDLNS